MEKNLLSATQIASLKKRFERCKTQILALDWVTQGSLRPIELRSLARWPRRSRWGLRSSASNHLAVHRTALRELFYFRMIGPTCPIIE